MSRDSCDCDGDTVPGAFWPCASDGDDSHPYVERCDGCKRFPDDEAAAAAVSAATGNPVQWANVHGREGSVQPYVAAVDRQAEAFERITGPHPGVHFDLLVERQDGTRVYEWCQPTSGGAGEFAIDANGRKLAVWSIGKREPLDGEIVVVEGDTSPLRRRVVMAVVYAVDVLPGEEGDEQTATYERAVSMFTEPEGTELLFASGALAARTPDWQDPSFDVDVRSHDRTLKPIDFL